MNVVRELFETLKENPLMVIRKVAITVQTGVLFAAVVLLLISMCLNDGISCGVKYLGIGLLLYVCLILPTNIMIRWRQAQKMELDFREYILDKENDGDNTDLPDAPTVRVKTTSKRVMNQEELRCFALQCNDYVEKQESEEKNSL